MSVCSLLRSAYLLYFSRPIADRILYRAIRGKPIRSIVELGIDLESRTPRLIEIAKWRGGRAPMRYAGIDLFEARPDNSGRLTLKQAFAALKRPDVNVQLVPGDPVTALRRVANSLTGTDLLIIASGQDRESLAASWVWIPRMLTTNSLVFLEEPAAKAGETVWRSLSPPDIKRLAAQAARPTRKAA